jgi:hypothetical protein
MSNLLFDIICYPTFAGFYCYSRHWLRCPCGWVIWNERSSYTSFSLPLADTLCDPAAQPPGGASLRVLRHDRFFNHSSSYCCLGRSPKVRSIRFELLWSLTLRNRLARMRKVGLSSSQGRKPGKGWLPLPLRNRISGAWW